jgi:hypothetical protein
VLSNLEQLSKQLEKASLEQLVCTVDGQAMIDQCQLAEYVGALKSLVIVMEDGPKEEGLKEDYSFDILKVS